LKDAQRLIEFTKFFPNSTVLVIRISYVCCHITTTSNSYISKIETRSHLPALVVDGEADRA
jgi:hypothetical protein